MNYRVFIIKIIIGIIIIWGGFKLQMMLWPVKNSSQNENDTTVTE